MRREVESDQIFNSSPPILSKEAKTKRDDKEAKAAAKAAERAASKVAKEAAKAEERELKRIAKEEKAREKQLATDIAEVNKSKHDKKNSTPEMIVLLPDSLSDASVRNQVLEYMKRLGVDTKSYKNDMKPGNVVRWKRKVRARFDDEAGRWEPVPEFIQDEKHVLCHITSTEFVDLAVASITPDREIDTQDLNLHVTKLTNEFPGCKIIYLIESLGGWMRKNRNNRNRAYQDAIRSQNPEENEGQNKRKRKQTTAYVDEDSIEDALLQLQVKHGCLIYQTSCAAESAEWIKNFTEHISTIPYRQERLNAQSDAAFCMDVGQVKTGDNAQETYIRMLQEVHRLTPAMAYGVANLYPNVLALVCAFREHGPNMLEHVKKSANKNGGVTEARLGPAMSKRLFKVFLGANPSSTDGIA
ncbi:hypothetical protein UCRPC4_g01096 [Phaeomoniella chlamydospora]|uniref:ERCC4 domain-containing protein n=1 Tax=Phaeomoniella chlamydospora TaxID=158046 RepID=A0A0G2EZL3_PHACM|nr:hypothetical protein UCRPC4_g01096 [Phaeomoniella chlamydospora]